MRPLKVFYHMYDHPDAHEIGRQQIDLLFKSNLIGQAEFYMCLNMNASSPSWNWLRDIFAGWPNVHIIDMEAVPKEFELPTLIYLKQKCDEATEPFYCLYMHQKGWTWKGSPQYNNILDWRNLLEYFTITRWWNCVDALERGYDMAGPNYRNHTHGIQHPHYSGNFWWATSDYIKRIPKIQRPKDVNFRCQLVEQDDPPELRYRMEAELWHAMAKPNFYVIHDSMQDHYWFPYPKERYMK